MTTDERLAKLEELAVLLQQQLDFERQQDERLVEVVGSIQERTEASIQRILDLIQGQDEAAEAYAERVLESFRAELRKAREELPPAEGDGWKA